MPDYRTASAEETPGPIACFPRVGESSSHYLPGAAAGSGLPAGAGASSPPMVISRMIRRSTVSPLTTTSSLQGPAGMAEAPLPGSPIGRPCPIPAFPIQPFDFFASFGNNGGRKAKGRVWRNRQTCKFPRRRTGSLLSG